MAGLLPEQLRGAGMARIATVDRVGGRVLIMGGWRGGCDVTIQCCEIARRSDDNYVENFGKSSLHERAHLSALPRFLTSPESNRKDLALLDEIRLGVIVFSHEANDLAWDTHAHVFEVAIVAHGVLDQLVP
jgi:hypothetical protein